MTRERSICFRTEWYWAFIVFNLHLISARIPLSFLTAAPMLIYANFAKLILIRGHRRVWRTLPFVMKHAVTHYTRLCSASECIIFRWGSSNELAWQRLAGLVWREAKWRVIEKRFFFLKSAVIRGYYENIIITNTTVTILVEHFLGTVQGVHKVKINGFRSVAIS
jgi:hypothetical protein